jgi:DNA-binding SARP family transcriptional activator/DNA-binding XRE family transcriptional regulator
MDGGSSGSGARLGGLVREWRGMAELSQRELAARSGLSVTAVRDLEQGRSRRPRAGSLTALARALGLDAEQAAALARAAGQGPGLPGGGVPGGGVPGGGVPGGGVPGGGVPGSGLWVAVLGPVAAWRDGVALRLGPPGRRAVLALLALAGGELVRPETVIDVLWGQRPPGTAAELAAAHVSRLRRALGPVGGNGVVAGAGAAGHRLRAGAGQLDVVLFAELARQAAAAGDAAAACGLYERALGLWRGDPAEDVALLRGHPAVAELARRRAEVVAGYARAASALGWHERVIPLLEGLARAEPLNERAHARLMVALAGAGQQAAAITVYEHVRRRLDEELGVHPGAELADAHQRVLRHDVPTGGPAAAPTTIRTLPRDVAASTGRDDDLRALVAAAAGLLERSVALSREIGDAQGEAEALNATGALLAVSAGPQEALTAYRRALQLARQVGRPLDEARALEGAARCAARAGDQAAARASLREAVAIYQRIGAAEARPAAADLAATDKDARDNDPLPESCIN